MVNKTYWRLNIFLKENRILNILDGESLYWYWRGLILLWPNIISLSLFSQFTRSHRMLNLIKGKKLIYVRIFKTIQSYINTCYQWEIKNWNNKEKSALWEMLLQNGLNFIVWLKRATKDTEHSYNWRIKYKRFSKKGGLYLYTLWNWEYVVPTK